MQYILSRAADPDGLNTSTQVYKLRSYVLYVPPEKWLHIVLVVSCRHLEVAGMFHLWEHLLPATWRN